MNGILSTTPLGVLAQERNPFTDPRIMALLGMGSGMLQASGPSPVPLGFGPAIGSGLQQGMRSAAIAQEMRGREDELRMRQEEMLRRANMPQGYGPGTQLFRQGQDSPFYTVPFKPEPTPPPAQIRPESPLGKLAFDLQAGLITQSQFDEQFKKLTAPSQPLVTVDNRQESETVKAVGRELGEQYTGLLKADFNAPATIAKYQRLGSLLSQVNTGKFRGTIVDMKAAAKSMGFDLTAMGIADDVAPAQAARALSNQIALELRNPTGGAGMPGALSDQDRAFLLQMIPGLENDPGAIGKMIEYRVKLSQREQEVAKKARAYKKKHGKFDEDFYEELAEWSAKNPLFKTEETPTPKPATGALSPAEQQELEALRKRFKK